MNIIAGLILFTACFFAGVAGEIYGFGLTVVSWPALILGYVGTLAFAYLAGEVTKQG